MVAFNRVCCTVLAVSEIQRGGVVRATSVRDLLPLADPYVAQLIKNLQEEVRAERKAKGRIPHHRMANSFRSVEEGCGY